ncbi:hypothetical protein J0X14_06360 [Muricauda sp. CAU 1633]|uniref:alpha/beta hydrolase family esterase n=1 Tax=Allomuricauda sp. CAU 1633 TaxID=2816036 RepID=UPI001A8D0800|nr:hypothetical protein [Muricauda sp. CAU 1633]MBO0321911.1 hypothetical protein [Muricauda sp. CAU 1633]
MKKYTLKYIQWLLVLAMPLILNAQKSQVDSLEIYDRIRSYTYTQPKQNGGKVRIIFALHGSGMSMGFMEQVVGTQFNALAYQQEQTIMVYPEGFSGNWNDCRAKATYPAKKQQIDDVKFLLKIIERLKNQYQFQETEVFAVGYSNGGHMCFKLAKKIPSEFKGFAIVGANLPISVNDDCTSSNEAVSILLINGTADPINPYQGGEVWAGDGQTRGKVVSAHETRDYWLDLLKGEPSLESEIKYEDIYPQDNSRVVQRTYSTSESTKRVSTVEVINGGHHFANPDFEEWPEYLGNLNRDVNLPKIIMTFFDTL